MEEYFDRYYRKSTTDLQRDELQRGLLNRRIIWNGTITAIKSGDNDGIDVWVEPTNGHYGTAFLEFDKSQRPQLAELEVGQQIRFTGRIRSYVASPFLFECKLLRVLK